MDGWDMKKVEVYKKNGIYKKRERERERGGGGERHKYQYIEKKQEEH